MKIVILPSASEDLADGFAFYEQQSQGLGGYYLESLFSLDCRRDPAWIRKRLK
jgi:hypothetical protein